MDTVTGAPSVEIARWRSNELGDRPASKGEEEGGSGPPGTNSIKQSLFAAAGLVGGSSNGSARRLGSFHLSWGAKGAGLLLLL